MATTKQNDDLLIISEDEKDTDTLVLDDPIIEENTTENDENDLITFDTEAEEKNQTEPVTQDSENVFDISSDFNITEDASKETNLEENTSNNETDLNLGFWDFSIDENETKIEESKQDDESFSLETETEETTKTNNSSVGTMEDILSNTINQLSSRADIVENDINAEQNIISDLKTQITDLETKVKESETNVSELNSEKTMINKNIKSLEKMKEADITSDLTKETSAKVHNTKRRKAS